MRFIQDPDTGKMIPASEYVAKHGTDRLTAKQPNPMSAGFGDRNYQNLPVHGGRNGVEVVNSRRQHRQFMKDNNLTTVDDFSKPGGEWYKQEKTRNEVFDGTNEAINSERKQDVIKAAKQISGSL